jgi:hypothetical protein
MLKVAIGLHDPRRRNSFRGGFRSGFAVSLVVLAAGGPDGHAYEDMSSGVWLDGCIVIALLATVVTE